MGLAEFDQWLQPRPAAPRQDGFEMFFGILAGRGFVGSQSLQRAPIGLFSGLGDPGADRSPVFKKPQVLPAPLDSVMNRTEFVGLRVGETETPIEIDDEFQGLGDGIDVA